MTDRGEPPSSTVRKTFIRTPIPAVLRSEVRWLGLAGPLPGAGSGACLRGGDIGGPAGKQIELRINLSAYFPAWLWFARSESGSGGLASGGEGSCVGVSFQVPIALLPGRVRAKR